MVLNNTTIQFTAETAVYAEFVLIMHIFYMLNRPIQLRGELICAVKCACSTLLISKARHAPSCLCLFIRTEVVMHTSACQKCQLLFADAFIMCTAAVSRTI